ncbi:PaaI family thioesterase [Colwellia sp. MEBiC06753]
MLENFEIAEQQAGFSQYLGPFFQRFDQDRGQFIRALPIRAEHLNPEGVVHGGVLLAFLDYVCYRAIGDEISHQNPFATVQLNSNFLAAAKPGDIVFGVANITKVTKSLIFATGELYNSDRALMTGSGVWKLIGK